MSPSSPEIVEQPLSIYHPMQRKQPEQPGIRPTQLSTENRLKALKSNIQSIDHRVNELYPHTQDVFNYSTINTVYNHFGLDRCVRFMINTLRV